MRKSSWLFIRRMLKQTLTLAVIVTVFSGAVLAGIGLYNWIMTADEFAIETVMVYGNNYIDQNEIVAVAGIDLGSNIFSPNLEDSAGRIEQDPRVQKVFIRRHFPDRIVVHLVEREPIAYINLGRLFGMDHDGTPIPLPAPDQLPNLPIITGFETVSLRNLQESGISDTDRIKTLRALHILDALRAHWPEFVKNVSEVHVKNPDDPILYMMQDGVSIHLGVGGYRDKLERLRALQSRLEQDGITTSTIDLRFDHQAIIRPIVTDTSDNERS